MLKSRDIHHIPPSLLIQSAARDVTIILCHAIYHQIPKVVVASKASHLIRVLIIDDTSITSQIQAGTTSDFILLIIARLAVVKGRFRQHGLVDTSDISNGCLISNEANSKSQYRKFGVKTPSDSHPFFPAQTVFKAIPWFLSVDPPGILVRS